MLKKIEDIMSTDRGAVKVVIIGYLIFVVIFLLLIPLSEGIAEEDIYYVLCTEEGRVNVRSSPRKEAWLDGYLYVGDAIVVDDHSNGFAHSSDLSIESGEGWVSEGYLVKDAPTYDGGTYPIKSNGRVSCRQWINGKRSKWLDHGDSVTIIFRSDEWCLTTDGYVRTEFIDLDWRQDVVVEYDESVFDGLIYEEDSDGY